MGLEKEEEGSRAARRAEWRMLKASTSELPGYGLAGHGMVVLDSDSFDFTSWWRTWRCTDC